VKKTRLDKLLVERGLVPSRERAQALILAGKVRVKGHPVTKAGQQVAADADIELVVPDHPYVSRGALKLIAALDHHGIDPQGICCLDVGASTGGFTDVLLRRGARRVFAVDSGTNQLDWRLRSDDRVVSLEQENVRHMPPEKITEPCDLAVIDVSFISLTLVLPKVLEVLGPAKPVIALIKPQFEVGKDLVGKGGIVTDPASWQVAIKRIEDFADLNRMQRTPAIESPIKGTTGNVEFLMLLHTS